MKINKFFMGMLGALTLASCSSEGMLPDEPNVTPGDGDSRYMSVSIRNVDMGGTRGEGDQTPDPDNKNNIYEEGYSAENKVTGARFYFFREDGTPANAFNGKNYYDCQPTGGTPEMPNVEKVMDALIVFSANSQDVINNYIKKMVCIVNWKDNYDLPADNLSLDELTAITLEAQKKTSDNKYKCEAGDLEKGFVMTSASYYNDNPTNPNGITVAITPENIKESAEEAKKTENAVQVFVERLVAKVRVNDSWDDMGEDDKIYVTFDGKENCLALALKDREGGEYIYVDDDKTKKAYVIFDNWDLWWTTDKTNLFKKVGNWNLGWSWNHKDWHRSYWAENPDGVKLAKHNYLYPSVEFGKGNKDNYADHTAYCLENAADFNNNGLKKSYDPAKTTTNRTLVYFSARIVTVDESSKTATAADLAEWAGHKYTKAGVLDAMFAPNVNQFYFIKKTETVNDVQVDEDGTVIESGDVKYEYIPVQTNNLELVSGKKAGLAGETAESDARYLSYVNLVDEKDLWDNVKDEEGNSAAVINKLYRKSVAGGKNVYTEVDVETVNDQLEAVGGAKVWDGGNAYYYHELEHLGKTGSDDSGDFNHGVVRNHIYEVELSSVFGLGTPVLVYEYDDETQPWEDIIPQKPSKDAFFLGAQINILSWRVVNNKVSLGW